MGSKGGIGFLAHGEAPCQEKLEMLGKPQAGEFAGAQQAMGSGERKRERGRKGEGGREREREMGLKGKGRSRFCKPLQALVGFWKIHPFFLLPSSIPLYCYTTTYL